MTIDIQFYHLSVTPLEKALPRLLEKALASGFKSLVLCESDIAVARLNDALWSYHPNRFLPHGSAKDGFAARQPIYLTAKEENPGKADLLVITDGAQIDNLSDFKRLIDIFDGSKPESATAAEKRMEHYRAKGHNVNIIRQSSTGEWQKAA